MPLTNLQKVRSLVGDLDKLSINERVGLGTGVGQQHQLDMFPVRTGTLTVFISGTESSATGVLEVGLLDMTGLTVGSSGTIIKASYRYNALSDDEVQAAIDLSSGGGNLIAGAIAARSLAGNAARFFAYTQGSKRIDKTQIAKTLINLANSLEQSHKITTSQGDVSISVSTFDDSGTAFDEYDTAVASAILATGGS